MINASTRRVDATNVIVDETIKYVKVIIYHNNIHLFRGILSSSKEGLKLKNIFFLSSFKTWAESCLFLFISFFARTIIKNAKLYI